MRTGLALNAAGGLAGIACAALPAAGESGDLGRRDHLGGRGALIGVIMAG